MQRSAGPDAAELVPPGLPVVRQLAGVASARPWLAALPSLIEQVRAAYRLRLAAPLPGGSCSWVAPAWLPDGTPVILKIAWPHREMYGEPAALRWWGGHGAVRLLAHDPHRHALLLQRCRPGDPLAGAPAPAGAWLRTGCAVLRRLWEVPPPAAGSIGRLDAVAGGIERLDAVAREWAERASERMARIRPGYDPALVAEGVRWLRELPASAGREVLLHGDANPGNVLSAGAGRWLAIDPKPLVGDPAYDPWPLLEQLDDPFAYPVPAPVLRDRVALVAAELALDPQRIVQWAVARRVEAALDAAEHGDLAGGAAIMRETRVLAEL